MNLIDFRAIFVLVLIFVPLERLLPARRGQRVFRRQWLSDVTYLLLNGIVIRIGLALIVGAIVLVWRPDVAGGFIARQPFWLQVAAAIIIADAAIYTTHRLFHAVPWLWRFHAVHHSIEDLDWLAAHRVHPADHIVQATATYLPLYMLGFPTTAIAAQGVVFLVQAHLIHANIHINFGPLRHIIATPRYHHWHHANHAEAHDRNFAPSLTWLDRLFGTLYLPDEAPARFGTDDPVPDTYLRQFIWPLLRRDARPVTVAGLPQ